MDWTAHMRRILSRLGEDVTYTHGTGTPAVVRGVFMNSFQAADLGIAGVTAANPAFAAMTADLPAVAPGDTIQRGATTYTVRVKKPEDPGGFTLLELKRT